MALAARTLPAAAHAPDAGARVPLVRERVRARQARAHLSERACGRRAPLHLRSAPHRQVHGQVRQPQAQERLLVAPHQRL